MCTKECVLIDSQSGDDINGILRTSIHIRNRKNPNRTGEKALIRKAITPYKVMSAGEIKYVGYCM